MGLNETFLQTAAAAAADNFDVKAYTGDAITSPATTSQTIATEFQWDMIFFKSRDGGFGNICDTLRNQTDYTIVGGSVIATQSSNAETTGSSVIAYATLKDTTNTSVGSQAYIWDNSAGWYGGNANGVDYISYFFKGGGYPTAIMDGITITPAIGAKMVDGASDTTNWATTSDGQYPFSQTVNSVSKFSITHQQKTTGSGPPYQPLEIPHSLGVIPEFVILKIINDAADWQIYHVASGKEWYMSTNIGGGTNNATNNINTFSTVDSDLIINLQTGAVKEFICYAWASVDGVSHFGSYAGSGTSASVTFGGTDPFTPSLLIVKSYSGTSTTDWVVIDSVRGANEQLYLNNTDAYVASSGWSFDADGFTPAGDWDASGTNYLYCAWA